MATTKQLYSVTVETEVIVLATSAKDAERVAEVIALREIDKYAYAFTAEPMRVLPCDWDLDSRPYADGGEPQPEIGTLIQRGAAPEYSALMAKLGKVKASR